MHTPARQINPALCDICGGSVAEPMFEENGFFLVRCSRCGHFFVPSPPDDMRFSSIAEEQPPPDIQQIHELSRLPVFEKYVREVKRHATGGYWLDLGCGCGTLLGVAQREGFHPLGIETDPQRLAFCRAKGLTVHSEELGPETFRPESVSVVSLINVFSHLPSPAASFQVMARILKPGGLILVATSQCGRTVYRDEVTTWHIPDHLHFAGPDTFSVLASRLGLDLTHISRELSQKIVLSEKLACASRTPLRRILKFFLRRVPGLTEALARMTCLRHGYHHPRHEVVLILRKPLRENREPKQVHG
jgi:SAM-dependent methyltransferase